MIPVVMAAALFGRHWGGKIVEFVVDNAAVVAVLFKGHIQQRPTLNASGSCIGVLCIKIRLLV